MNKTCKICGKFYKDGHICVSKKVIVHCQLCLQGFEVYLSQILIGEGKFCSKECKKPFLRTLRLGQTISLEQINKYRETRFKNNPEVLCNTKYKNVWGEMQICKNNKKRYRKTCGKHVYSVQLYFCSSKNPYYCIDISL